MSNEDKASYVKHLLNDPILKWILRCVGFVLLVFIVIFTVRAATGKHVNFLGIEMNMPDERKPDTLRVANPKPDTIFFSAKQEKSLPKNVPVLGLENKKPNANKKADTVAKQQTTVTGDNAHVISGNNNKVDVNGDIRVSQQPELNDWYKQFFIRHIDQVRRDSSITSNKIIIHLGNGSNAGMLASELSSFLKDKGYDISMATTFEPFKGVGVAAGIYFDNVTKAVDIYIGNISQ